jgi:Holliday junction resolvase-like predicted endonuclease
MPRGFHARKQGDIGEAKAMAWLTEVGATVWVPLLHSSDADVIAEFDGLLQRVQVKTSTCVRGERYAVQIATSGGNQSWTGCVKHFSRQRCDFLFVHVGDGRSWFIPAAAVDGSVSILLGGPKYSEYLIGEDGRIPAASRPALQCPPLRGSAGVGEPGRTVNSVASPERVRIPPPPSAGPTESVTRRSVGRSRLSTCHQMTVPIGPFHAAELAVGDQIEVTAEGPGELRLSRVHPATITTPAGPGSEEAA